MTKNDYKANALDGARKLNFADNKQDRAQAFAHRILIVEDEPEILEALAHSFNKEGYSVLRAEDGLTACRIIGSEKPDLILLDIMLPDLDGWEVCKLLRQHPDASVATVPVIMLTALNAPHDKYRGLGLGADAFLPKPYAIREVILHSENLLRRRRQTLNLENRIKTLSSNERKTLNLQHLLFHELRNQLLILNGYTELLHKDPGNKRAQTCRDAIYRSSNYLQNLAEGVMLIRQVEDGELALELQNFDADQLLAEIITVYLTPAKEKCMELKHIKNIKPESINLNRTALKIVLSALIDNSLKYGPSGQTVTLSCRRRKELWEVVVTDQGPGIPYEDQPRIFEPYFRSSRNQSGTRGSGIGLHAVSVLSKAMGGQACVESKPGQGSTFRLSFPALKC